MKRIFCTNKYCLSFPCLNQPILNAHYSQVELKYGGEINENREDSREKNVPGKSKSASHCRVGVDEPSQFLVTEETIDCYAKT